MILSEIKDLLGRVAKWLLVLIILACYFFTFPFHRPFAVQIFEMMRADLVPAGVSLIASNPFMAFIVEMKIAFFLALIFSFPFMLWGALRYFSPALKSRERSAVYKVVVPSTLLFFSGGLFAYFFVIPATIRILYEYTHALGATAFFSVDDFITLIFEFVTVTGLLFLMPVAIFLTSAIGIIPYEFWRDHWRHALFVFTLFSALITPDGTGVTMVLLMIPLTFLYVAGLLVSRRYRAVASN